MADDHPDEVKHWVGKFYAMEKQRDELLAACRLARGQLQSAADWARTEHREDGATRAFDACCAAIAKAEKKE